MPKTFPVMRKEGPAVGAADNEADVLSEEFFEARRKELKARLPKKSRYRHSLGVAEESVRLAKLYGADVRKARLAGLLHDWDKGYDDEGIRARVAELGLEVDPFLFEHMPQLLHGPTAAAALAKRFPQLPADVLSAIERHTAGATDMSDLDMIVYVADVIEPNRDFPGVDKARELARVSLDRALLYCYDQTLIELVTRGKLIHSDTIAAYNDMIRQGVRWRDE